MLPSNLFSARVLKGKLSPRYLALDDRSVALAREMIGIFGQSLGKKRRFLTERLEQLETSSGDYKIVRGLAAILDRRCTPSSTRT